tara:strand:- start:256 stop:1158 length:903 start_codon:yes stop_codon:yes gene_type:complete
MRSHRLRAAAGGDSGEIVAGAVLHWDFGDTNCWNRTNSTVTDLSGNNRNGTIQNYNTSNESHSYNSGKGGYLEASNSSGAQYTMEGIDGGGFRTSGGWWGSSNWPHTLEFISDTRLNRYKHTTAQSYSYTTQDALIDTRFIFISGGFQFNRYSLLITGDGSGGGYPNGDTNNEISEFGIGAVGTQAFSTAFRDINDYSPNANLLYSRPSDSSNSGWQQLIVTTASNRDVKMYRNGTLIYSVNNTNINQNEQTSTFNSLLAPVERWFRAQGGWGVIRGYDKALTAAEVLGQYNAQKSRFGI